MKPPTLTRVAVALLAAALALGTAARAGAQPNWPGQPLMPQQPLAAIPGGGTEVFRALLAFEGVQPVRAHELNGQNGNDDLIVVVIGPPDVDFPSHALSWARAALRDNGAVLIASNTRLDLYHAKDDPRIADHVTRFNGGILHADRNDGYRDKPDCPFVVPVSPDELRNAPPKPGRVWDVFRGLNRLATNRPTYIEPFAFRDEFRYPLARMPKSAHPNGWGRFAAPPLFAVGGDGPDQPNGDPGYSFLAVAGDGVYINQMMEPDTDNLKFTVRTIEYLQGPDKHRKRCAFFENGRLVERFDVGLREALVAPKPKPPPAPAPQLGPLFGKNQEALINGVDRMADQLQTDDRLHKSFIGPPGSAEEQSRFAGWAERIAVVAAVGIVLLLLRRTITARQPLNVPPAPNTGAGAAITGPPGVFDRRQRELVRRNNLYEPVRNLMREFFDSVGAPPQPGPRLPPLEITYAVRKPESLRQAIRDMWRIAYGPPTHISAQRWFELEPYFDRLRNAHADGKWRFVTDEA